MPILTQFRQINITYIKDDSFFSLELFTDAKNDNLELWKKITSFHRLSHILILRNLHKTKALVFLSHEKFMDIVCDRRRLEMIKDTANTNQNI